MRCSESRRSDLDDDGVQSVVTMERKGSHFHDCQMVSLSGVPLPEPSHADHFAVCSLDVHLSDSAVRLCSLV